MKSSLVAVSSVQHHGKRQDPFAWRVAVPGGWTVTSLGAEFCAVMGVCPPGRRATLAFGGELSLWDPWLLKWLLGMRPSAPDLALRAQIGVPDHLMTKGVVHTVWLEIRVLPGPPSAYISAN